MRTLEIRNHRTRVALVLAVAGVLGGCASTPEARVNTEGVEVKLRRIEVENASFEQMDLKVILLASNPTDVPLGLNGGEVSVRIAGPGAPQPEEGATPVEGADEGGDLSVEGIVTGDKITGVAPTGTLEALQSTEIPVRLSLPLPADAEALGRLLAWLRMTLEVNGVVRVEGNPVPFAGTREVATPRLPRVVVKEAQVASVDRGQKGVVFFALGLDNPNPFAITVDQFAWGATVGGKTLLPVGEGSVERVPPSSVATFEDTLQLNPETYGKDVRKLLQQPRVPYRLDGYFEFRGIKRNFEFDGEMEFAR